MKNKLFSFQVFAQPSVNGNSLTSKHAIRILLVFAMAIVLGQTNLTACKIAGPQANVAAQFEGWNFHGEAIISPAVSGYSVVNITPLFESLDGFETAQLNAELSDEGDMLFVTLTNVGVSTLPANATLGIVTISNGDDEMVFEVWTDGGGLIDVIADI
jgi:hypothetical protein